MASIVTNRFIECLQKLKEDNMIRSSRQFALSLDYHPQNLNEIERGNRDAPLELIRKAVEIYRINPLYLYSGNGALFLDQEGKDNFRVLTISTNAQNEERIVHVPVPAQAGYSCETIDPVFLQDLPSYTLPDMAFQMGTFRSFDVSGDSMERTLFQGEKVICSFLEPTYWISGIRDYHVYVIVTRGAVVVKRVINNLQKHRHLVLESDNDFYKSYRVNINEIKEIWYVKAVFSNFSHSRPEGTKDFNSIDALKETIDQQSALIRNLNTTIEKIIKKA